MRAHYLQHVPFEGIGSMQNWFDRNGYEVTRTRLFADEPLPLLDEFDWLIVMGGPMNIYEEDAHPWLRREKEIIRRAIDANKVVIGICLGAQLIADVLGAKVTRNKFVEIGWFPIQMSEAALELPLFKEFPQQPEVFHWHGDTFGLSGDAVQLARSAGCANQGFLYKDRVVAFQFHLEMGTENARLLVENCGDEIVEGEFIQSGEFMLADECRFLKVNQLMDTVLDGLHLILIA